MKTKKQRLHSSLPSNSYPPRSWPQRPDRVKEPKEGIRGTQKTKFATAFVQTSKILRRLQRTLKKLLRRSRRTKIFPAVLPVANLFFCGGRRTQIFFPVALTNKFAQVFSNSVMTKNRLVATKIADRTMGVCWTMAFVGHRRVGICAKTSTRTGSIETQKSCDSTPLALIQHFKSRQTILQCPEAIAGPKRKTEATCNL